MRENNTFEIVKTKKQLSISFSSAMKNIDRIDKESRKLLEKRKDKSSFSPRKVIR